MIPTLLFYLFLWVPGSTVDCPGLAIVSQPQPQTVCYGDSAVFSITATGVGTLAYQWRRECVEIPGATGDQLIIDNISESDFGAYSCVVSDDCGVLTSEPGQLAPTPITITQQPVSLATCVGLPASFQVIASGQNLTYQWRKECQPLVGEIDSVLAFEPVSSEDVGTYECVVSNGCSSLTTVTVYLTTPFALAITSQPQDLTVCSGQNASFSLSATGTGTLNYQWYKNSVLIPGANQGTLSLNGVSNQDAASYRCDVSNLCGILTTRAAVLTVANQLSFTNQPQSVTSCPGSDVSFSVAVAGVGPFTYQWQFNGFDLPGQTSASINLTDINQLDAGQYLCVVSNSCGPVASNPATLSLTEPFGFTSQPADFRVCPGDSVTFSVTPDGAGPFQYQWRRNCVPIAGALSASLMVNNIGDGELGSYSCVVADSCGSVTSESGALVYHPNCNFPDPSLRQFVGTGTWSDDLGNSFPIDSNGDGYVSEAEALAVTGILDLTGLGIADLTGIGAFANILELICSFNEIETLPDLSAMTQLTLVDMSSNRLRIDNPGRAGALLPTSLTRLHLDYNRLQSLPDLSNLVLLERLTVTFNLLSDIQDLVDLGSFGTSDRHRLRIGNNLLDEASDCSNILNLETRFGTAGGDFRYAPQFSFNTLTNWPLDAGQTFTILDILPNLEFNLDCVPADGP